MCILYYMYISIYIYTYLVTCDDLFKPKPSQVEIGWDIDNCFTQIHRNRIKTHMLCDSPQMHQHLEIAYLFHMVLRCCIVIAQWVPYIRKYRHLAIWISQKKHQGKPKITHNNPWDMFKTAKNIFWLQRKIGGSPQDLSVNCNLTSPQWNYIK